MSLFAMTVGGCGGAITTPTAPAADPSGVRTVANVAVSGAPSGPMRLVGDRIVFGVGSSGTGELWATDGSTAGTQRLAQLGDRVRDLNVSAGRAYFRVAVSNAPQIWASDGTVTGTFRVPDGGPYSAGLYLAHRGILYYFADFFVGDALFGRHDQGLWRTDGTAAGTWKFRSGFGNVRRLADTVVIEDLDGRLYVTNGAPGDERFLPGPRHPSTPVEFKGRTYFMASDDRLRRRMLWRSDGSPEGTDALVDFGSLPVGGLLATPQHLYFNVIRDRDRMEIWRTDGTGEGTLTLRDFAWSYDAQSTPRMVAAGSNVFVIASEGGDDLGLYRSDGTPEGTTLIRSMGTTALTGPHWDTLACGDRLYVALAPDDASSSELWASDGTPSGTRRLGTLVGTTYLLGCLDRELYFQASDQDLGREIWRSDGTQAGTRVIADLNPGPAGTVVGTSLTYGDELYVLADPGTGLKLLALSR